MNTGIAKNHWKDDMETYRQIYLDMKSALTFKKGSKIGIKDLEIVLRRVKRSKELNIRDIKTKYTPVEMKSIIMRLKRLGEVFDPYYGTGKAGEYVRPI